MSEKAPVSATEARLLLSAHVMWEFSRCSFSTHMNFIGAVDFA